MPNKFDLLREGKAIEFEPGITGKLNKQNKTLELSSGEVINAENDPDFFPKNDQSLALSRQKESYEKSAAKSGGEFIHQFTTQGIAGAGRDWIDYLKSNPEEYKIKKQAQQQVSNRISQDSPYTNAAATGANFATDFALTRGMSALKAAPALTLGSSGSRIVTEPEEVLGEIALVAAGGKGLDLAGGYLNRVATRRGASRAIPAQQQAVNEANINQTEAFNSLKNNIKSTNEARLQQHQIDLNARQNKMIQSQNTFEQAKLARDTEVIRLKNQAEVAKSQRSADASRLDSEYKAAKSSAEQETKRLNDEFKLSQSEYQDSLKKLPELQKKAQSEYSQNIVKNVSEIEKNFPKNSKISSEQLGLNEFIEEKIKKSGIGGTREAGQAQRILKSLFPEDEFINGRELSKRYKALEDALQRSTPEVQTVLNDFKNHLGKKLPLMLENSITYNKIFPLIKKNIGTDIVKILRDLNLGKEAGSIGRKADMNLKNILRNDIVPADFIQKLQNGELARDISSKLMTVDDFLVDLTGSNTNLMKKEGTLAFLMKDAEKKHAYFVTELTQKLQDKLSRYEIKAMESARNASKKLGKDVKKTYGMAEPVAAPNAPLSPNPVSFPQPAGELPPLPAINLPPPVQPPQNLPLPGRPTLMSTPNVPNPIPNPTLAPAQGMAERTGDFLERPILGSGTGITNNPLLKLGGLKYLFGKAALPAEAAYLGLKGLTSPTAAGEVARMTFKQGGIEAIESWAQKYPSYQNGILQNPMERRSLTKEIEDDPQIPIEQKALTQSKINRGKPISGSL